MQATEYIKEATITHMTAQGQRPVQTSTQSSILINLASAGTWTVNGGSGGTSTCHEGAAVVPNDNKLMQGIALTAIASGAKVMVAVDNTLPMVASYCQISMLTLVKP